MIGVEGYIVSLASRPAVRGCRRDILDQANTIEEHGAVKLFPKNVTRPSMEHIGACHISRVN